MQYAVAADGVDGATSLPTRPQFRRWVRAALATDMTVTVRIVGEAEGRRLNADYRGKALATNVLSFSYGDQQPVAGDIVLCAPLLRREAFTQDKPLAAHYAHLTVHGMLHLQGYDHQRDSDANRMERLETVILRRLGYGDPHAETRMKDEG